MATIQIVTAKSGLNIGERHFGRSRSFNIYIDGAKAGTIPNGRKESFAVAAGVHTIFAKTDMSWSSREVSIDVRENDSKVFHVRPSSQRIWMVALVLSGLLVRPILNGTKAAGYVYLLLLLIVGLILALVMWRTPGLTLTPRDL